MAPDGVGGPSGSVGSVDEHATNTAHNAAMATGSFDGIISYQGVNVGGVTSVRPAMMRPMLIKAGFSMLSQ